MLLENRVHKQELELLNNELLKQKRQIETLQQLVECGRRHGERGEAAARRAAT